MLPQTLPVRYLVNPGAHPSLAYGSEREEILNRRGHAVAFREVSTWEGYGPTPLVELKGIAESVGVGALWYKDESPRLGLGSFKALGGIYGVFRTLQTALEGAAGGPPISSRDFWNNRFKRLLSGITVTCASAGNHGRAVARAAQMFGCEARVFLPEHTSHHRVRSIQDLGASTVLVEGTFDEAVSLAASEAEKRGWLVVADTTFAGYQDIPRHIMQGYTVLAREILEQLPEGVTPTHVFLQAGVGGLAAAVTGHFWEVLGPDRPLSVIVEPAEADCLLESALFQRRSASRGTLATSMECLACRKVSSLAWEFLAEGAGAFLTISDRSAEETVSLLRGGFENDPAVFTQPSGAAGVAGLFAAACEPALASTLGLGKNSTVLVIGSEGPADEEKKHERFTETPKDPQ